MLNVQDLRNGVTFLLDGAPYVCLKYEHVKMGRGSATIRIKARNLLTGATTEKSFVNSARVEEINTVRRPMQYLYKDGKNFVFMDPKNYEQVGVSSEVVGSEASYLLEGTIVNILFWDERPLWIELPPKMEFTVKETDPGVKGNSVSNLYKDAVLDNGVKTRVPLFINQGDKVLIDTRDGSYAERVK
ncbi:MAG: Elongation factor P [Candidatus Amesbacteria bacterium GW2011_GWB1_47_26]|uniref:Elongation factor P n=1 Tax=Candidatus Amesbacteria bacterium GW2011_GWC2_45_19 TaxID=1618366 RepID=A0A0G1Q2N4_9BACT|nr:MAG: Elongation factor P [Candidatus Amesbacteria bacterium GW2011_GWC2_45_19]KKU38387.1 MAG: Elongation factor P [Candidatus Amesbacteria bacterium GW2011_GWA1_46_35]KKU68771.1 MAG: Translation elongation factor P [Microgenomates group bacterium GW2011_GWC1_47_20]KKU73394.1 MAG: Elongation factor P [Candidatus Amesbacteria bacterium GW2011_GWB1_47_26]